MKKTLSYYGLMNKIYELEPPFTGEEGEKNLGHTWEDGLLLEEVVWRTGRTVRSWNSLKRKEKQMQVSENYY